MTAFFFGPAERQIFGYYHAPRGEQRSSVVICPPWGSDYQYAHRSLRVMARKLAEKGFHVLRFDYTGTGDSWGDGTVASFERWREDVGLAIDELRAMSLQPRVDLVGLRMGALLAATAAGSRDDVDRIVLWDPILDGSRWMGEINGARPSPSANEGAPIEFAQRVVSRDLLREFETIRPESYGARIADRALLLHTVEGEESPAQELRHVAGLEERRVIDASPWLEDTSIWSGLVPTKAVNAIIEWLSAP